MRANRSRWMPAICLSALALTESAGAQQAQTPYAGHGAESVPREKVAKYAPTPLPGGVTRRIQMMLDVRGAVLGTLSPDGKRLFFTWSITGTPNVWRLDGPKSFPVQLTGGEDPTRLSGVTPDGKYLVLSRDVGGQEDPGLYLQLADGGPLTEVHHKKGTRAGYGFSTARLQNDLFQRQRHRARQLRHLPLRHRRGETRAGLRSARTLDDRRPSRRARAARSRCCSRRRQARCRASSPSTTSRRAR